MLINHLGIEVPIAAYRNHGNLGFMTSAGYQNSLFTPEWLGFHQVEVDCDPVYLVERIDSAEVVSGVERVCKYRGCVHNCWIQRMSDGTFCALVFAVPQNPRELRLMTVVEENLDCEQDALDALARFIEVKSPRLPSVTEALLAAP
jgi:hypothetical protein